MKSKSNSAMTLALLTAIMTTPIAVSGVIPNPLWAQAPAESPAFPLPSRLAKGATVKIDSSKGMSALNQALKQGFEQKFADAKVETTTRDTDAALNRVLTGKADLAAIGRSLSEPEKSKGLKPVVLSRESIALVVGATNPFSQNLTEQQFAKMVRGEIADWSQLGRTAGKIRVVDRPTNSDTRQSLLNHPVFKSVPIKAGAATQPLTEDSTDAMVKALGKDGIGYAIYSQVKDRQDVKIIPLQKMMPSDARYPFSQPWLYVYSKNPSETAKAFLGFASDTAGRKLVAAAKTPEATTGGNAKVPGAALNAPAKSTDTVGTDGKPGDGANAGLASSASTQEDELPWWLLPGVALLGGCGLLWFLGKRGNDGDAPAGTAPAATAPLMGAANEGDGHDRDIPGNLTPEDVHVESGAPDTTGSIQDERVDQLPKVMNELSHPAADLIEGSSSGNSNEVDGIGISTFKPALARDAALAGGAAIAGSEHSSTPTLQDAWLDDQADSFSGITQSGDSRIFLAPHEGGVYAYWNIPREDKEALRQQGGILQALRLYDVTDLDLSYQTPHSMQQYEAGEMSRDQYLPVLLSDRDYVVEIGYTTADGRWLLLSRSAPTRISFR